MSAAVIQADIARAWSIGSDHIWSSVTVQIGNGSVSRGPFWSAPSASRPQVSFAVIQVDQFAIRRVVAYHNVQVTVAIDVSEHRRIRTIRRRTEIGRSKPAFAVVQQNPIQQRR